MKFANFLTLLASSGVRADVELGPPCATVSNSGDDVDGSAIVIYSGEEVDNMRRSDKYKQYNNNIKHLEVYQTCQLETFNRNRFEQHLANFTSYDHNRLDITLGKLVLDKISSFKCHCDETISTTSSTTPNSTPDPDVSTCSKDFYSGTIPKFWYDGSEKRCPSPTCYSNTLARLDLWNKNGQVGFLYQVRVPESLTSTNSWTVGLQMSITHGTCQFWGPSTFQVGSRPSGEMIYLIRSDEIGTPNTLRGSAMLENGDFFFYCDQMSIHPQVHAYFWDEELDHFHATCINSNPLRSIEAERILKKSNKSSFVETTKFKGEFPVSGGPTGRGTPKISIFDEPELRSVLSPNLLRRYSHMESMINFIDSQSNITRYWTYGCWCFQMDNVDKTCKHHKDCYACVKADAGESSSCVPEETGYKFRAFYDSVTGKPEIECQNRPGSCRRNTCECDKALAMGLDPASSSDDGWNSAHHAFYGGFDSRTKCLGRMNTNHGSPNHFKQCCGEFPNRFPMRFANDGSGNQCCAGSKIYDSSIKECCSDGSVNAIGSC
ncbi:Oidioi.mRNA.OKI2018_I69.chr1.g157.t1.cds [Oikopleura dioica]|uniref:Oidioi.mRNA.OKI2018_I69.chr1.g157.t1.cds n=1 Tax=Oikopleura dioica TaxID=34765 RepID=A0ABN7SIZ5_OIKDI|nr:Oidioi.mRNA.OKI2018_I69.chr1.g157.t1.cds [Oikopleura dioica]